MRQQQLQQVLLHIQTGLTQTISDKEPVQTILQKFGVPSLVHTTTFQIKDLKIFKVLQTLA